ncbi:bifunctional DNA-formamidopyrimidine glycosylase/DNA-(apurinic or apyrimidinic site) lyase [Legionella impletisoli]|uniref:Formamidopyrimidine-DNA glycosylase n=1 Tax=Legionella impletisoli TaxID=343510 RepID=A0A917JW05_9GAMM|nr:bifunctional DNA-formamidopyrimidine glycosylase/DNA-(apurinic or apyrimidinic site) lyase [Legionella impletisoli]GGI88827.1 formamidopyrimidine-DNA glycosylase [Legionella impletisoli]
MPELPEVETTRWGLYPHLIHQSIEQVLIHQSSLRRPIPDNFNALCKGKTILDITRRSKYLILTLTEGAILIHLGMSGHLRILDKNIALKKHDHVEVILSNQQRLRYHDPRRFGLWLYTNCDPLTHPLLTKLGKEPLTESFNIDYLAHRAICKKQSIKSFIMDNQIVVGIGNIYATESLFMSGIHPLTPAGTISKDRLERLIHAIKSILSQALQAGGTTLKDFYSSDGKPGYFALNLNVYGRQGLSCKICHSKIESVIISGRRSTFCPQCQPK